MKYLSTIYFTQHLEKYKILTLLKSSTFDTFSSFFDAETVQVETCFTRSFSIFEFQY